MIGLEAILRMLSNLYATAGKPLLTSETKDDHTKIEKKLGGIINSKNHTAWLSH
jgi:hypothetical protein